MEKTTNIQNSTQPNRFEFWSSRGFSSVGLIQQPINYTGITRNALEHLLPIEQYFHRAFIVLSKSTFTERNITYFTDILVIKADTKIRSSNHFFTYLFIALHKFQARQNIWDGWNLTQPIFVDK